MSVTIESQGDDRKLKFTYSVHLRIIYNTYSFNIAITSGVYINNTDCIVTN